MAALVPEHENHQDAFSSNHWDHHQRYLWAPHTDRSYCQGVGHQQHRFEYVTDGDFQKLVCIYCDQPRIWRMKKTGGLLGLSLCVDHVTQ